MNKYNTVKSLLFVTFIPSVIVILLSLQGYKNGLIMGDIIGGMSSFFLILVAYFCLGIKEIQGYLRSRVKSRVYWEIAPIAYLLISYCVYSLSFNFVYAKIFKLISFISLPLLISFLCKKIKVKSFLVDICIILSLWLPIELNLLEGLWPWPEKFGDRAYLVAMTVPLLAYVMIISRNHDRVKYSWDVSKSDILLALKQLCFFLSIAIPLGIFTGFIEWSGWKIESSILFTLMITFLLVAVPEELLFRGVIQNLLTQSLKSSQLGLLVASLVFGLAHLNNGPTPDWRYFVLSTIAGLFYGVCYQRGQSLMSAAILHTLVDTIWVHYFRG